MTKKSAIFTKNFIFGVEDSLVSTVGLLSGVAAANVDKPTIFISGVILIFVEAFSMGVGSFLSEQSTSDFTGTDRPPSPENILGATVMFISYFGAGFIPLFPYIVLPIKTAFWVAIIASLSALFILGSASARYFKHKDLLRHGIQMLLIGGVAITAGVLVGTFLN